MEHRWGQRIALGRPVRVRCGSSEGAAVLMDGSVSGAFIRTRLCLRQWASVEVQVAGEPVPAWVVRATPAGFGVEWSEFAPLAVVALLECKRETKLLNRGAAIGRSRESARHAPAL
jgi:hypothetical protein